MSTTKKSVLFVCLGNICRSTMAEAVFLRMLDEKGIRDKWNVDSAALGSWNLGNNPDNRTTKVLQKNGITNYKHKAREICDEDYTKFEYILGMDEENMSDLEDRKPRKSTAKVTLLGEYDPEGELIIRDPYYDGKSDLTGFEQVYQQCMRCCQAFLDKS